MRALAIDAEDVAEAGRRLAGVVARTPVLTSRSLDASVGGARLFLKAECFQRTGSFKFRGASNCIGALSPDDRARGVVAFSSGNHAQAVALAARELATTATILMPHDAPASKVEATLAYGAQVLRFDRYEEDREELARALVDERGAVLVPPFDHPLVMAGQGTAALELLAEVPDLGTLVVPVGGGGLIAGCATAAKARLPGIRVVGVEPEAGDDTKKSMVAGERVRIDVPRTIADGQQVASPGELTFPIVQRLVDEVVTVTDDAIIDAMRLLFERLKLVVEPSGACALAAVLAGAVGARRGDRVGVILSGGNIDATRFAQLVAP